MRGWIVGSFLACHHASLLVNVRAAEAQPLAVTPTALIGARYNVKTELIPVPDGGYLFHEGRGGWDVPQVRLDGNGQTLWRLPSPAFQRVGSAAPLADGRILMVGSAYTSMPGVHGLPVVAWIREQGPTEVYVVLDHGQATANPGGNRQESIAEGCVELTGGDLMLVGTSSLAPGPGKTSPAYGRTDGWAMRVDMHGAPIWEQSYGGQGIDDFRRLIRYSDDRFVLAGMTQRGERSFPWILCIDGSGTPLWETVVEDWVGELPAEVMDAKETKDGGLIVAAVGYNPGRGFAIRIDADGRELWRYRIQSSEATLEAHAALELGDRNFLVAGVARGGALNGELWFRCLTPEGQLRWETRLHRSGGYAREPSVAMVELLDGRVAWLRHRGSDAQFGFVNREWVPSGGAGLTLLPLGGFETGVSGSRLSINGPEGRSWVLERSADFVDWAPASSGTIGRTNHLFEPGPLGREGHVFFRIREP